MKTQSSPFSVLRSPFSVLRSPFSVLRSPLRTLSSLSLALLFAVALSSTAFGAPYVLLYDSTTRESPSGIIPPFDYVDHLTATDIAAFGGVAPSAGGGVSFENWGTAISTDKYVGFSISAEEGFQLNLTNLDFSTTAGPGSVAAMVTGFQWGYRVDANSDGTFEQDWVFDQLYTSDTPGFSVLTAEKSWDFSDFSTTGTVEFGLFAQGAGTNFNRQRVQAVFDNMSVEGSVTAVPEPSTYGLVIGAGLTALVIARRRKTAANS